MGLFQYDRNINLVLHGIPEEKGANTSEIFIQIISENLPVALSHRLGCPQPSSWLPSAIVLVATSSRYINVNTEQDLVQVNSTS